MTTEKIDNLPKWEDCDKAVKRIPILLQIPAAKRFISCEPLLGNIDLKILRCVNCEQWIEGPCAYCGDCKKPNWVIVGCESGPNRRPCKIEWVRSIVQQCREASVPVFVKQLSIDGKVSHDMDEWPEDLRIREFPK